MNLKTPRTPVGTVATLPKLWHRQRIVQTTCTRPFPFRQPCGYYDAELGLPDTSRTTIFLHELLVLQNSVP